MGMGDERDAASEARDGASEAPLIQIGLSGQPTGTRADDGGDKPPPTGAGGERGAVQIPGAGTVRTAPEVGLYGTEEGRATPPDPKAGAYAFRAGSVLPEDEISEVTSRVYILRHEDEFYGVRPDVFHDVFGTPGAGTTPSWATSIDISEAEVRFAVTRDAVPEMIQSVGSYNVVVYDGWFYAVPQQLGPVRWGQVDIARMPGVKRARTLPEAFRTAEAPLGLVEHVVIRGTSVRFVAEWGAAAVRRRLARLWARCRASRKRPVPGAGASSVPRLVDSLNGYNIVEFEGWFYGIPQVLGDVRLEDVDVIEMRGVIRDLSRDVVEREIWEMRRKRPRRDWTWWWSARRRFF